MPWPTSFSSAAANPACVSRWTATRPSSAATPNATSSSSRKPGSAATTPAPASAAAMRLFPAGMGNTPSKTETVRGERAATKPSSTTRLCRSRGASTPRGRPHPHLPLRLHLPRGAGLLVLRRAFHRSPKQRPVSASPARREAPRHPGNQQQPQPHARNRRPPAPPHRPPAGTLSASRPGFPHPAGRNHRPAGPPRVPDAPGRRSPRRPVQPRRRPAMPGQRASDPGRRPAPAIPRQREHRRTAHAAR